MPLFAVTISRTYEVQAASENEAYSIVMRRIEDHEAINIPTEIRNFTDWGNAVDIEEISDDTGREE